MDIDTNIESYTSVSEDPILQPIYYWSLIQEEIIFLEVPNVGSGR